MAQDNVHYPANESLILVSVISSVRDLEIARILGWYRIPFRSAPKVINVDFLAFYQTSVFGPEDGCRINLISEVRGHELVSRKELFRDEVDHPRANEEYYKIQLGPLQILPIPILAKDWKRITFFYTTGELLSRARYIHDLVIRSEERVSLWHSLRERVRKDQVIGSADEDLEIDMNVLAWLGECFSPKSNESEQWLEDV